MRNPFNFRMGTARHTPKRKSIHLSEILNGLKVAVPLSREPGIKPRHRRRFNSVT